MNPLDVLTFLNESTWEGSRLLRTLLAWLPLVALAAGCGEPREVHRVERTPIPVANPETGAPARAKLPRAIATH